MNESDKILAKKLLEIKAVKIQPSNPFTWASGWKSPFYCDNRKTLSYPEVRTYIKESLAQTIRKQFPEAEVLAAVATGGIAQGALVADLLGLPMVYVRSAPKDHGLENLIEGDLKPGAKVLVVEDLISTGGSSLKVVEALRAAGSQVVGMVATYTYGFPVAEKAFEEAEVRLVTLTDYKALIDVALETGYIRREETDTLQAWRINPAGWRAE